MNTRYELFEQLGRNHYSTVHSARDMTLGRDVAIMELHEKFRNDSSRWPSIWRQVRTLMDSKLENVVQVFDAVETCGWLVMEKMRGNLKQEIARQPLSPGVVRSVLRQSLVALQSYHRHGVLHGDIKPANLLFNNDGYAKLAFSPGLQLGGQIPQRDSDFKYFAPELLNQQLGAVEPALDLYCLGFAAAELLKGPEFDGLFKGVGKQAIDADAAWMRWHSTATELLPSIATLVPNCPDDLVRVLDRLLAKPVADRYPSADAALADLAEGPQERVVIPDVPRNSVKKSSSENAPSQPDNKKIEPPTHKPPVKPPRPFNVKQLKPFSRDWINKKLEDPRIMYSACALIILPVMIYLFLPASSPPYDIKVSWTPKDAAVKIDNNDFRPESGSVVQLARGNHSISISKEGFSTVKEDFEVPLDGQKELSFTLSKNAPAKLLVGLKWNPPNAVATLDNKQLKEVSGGTFSLASGNHSIELTLDGYETYKETFAVGENFKRSFSLNMRSSSPLPDGLAPSSESPIDNSLKLPTVAVSTRFKGQSRSGEFALIPAGKFAFGIEHPLQSELSISTEESVDMAFYVGKTEVTNEQFVAYAHEVKLPEELPSLTQALQRVKAGAGREPVLGVPYTEALQFCRWMSQSGDLPTEREWEKAARGQEGRLYPWGDDSSVISDRVRLFVDGKDLAPCDVDDQILGQTPEGVLHMLGNAAEWCQDFYKPGFDDVENGFPGIDTNHVIRGASFRMLPTNSIRLTWRSNVLESGDVDVGFRVVIRTKVGAVSSVK